MGILTEWITEWLKGLLIEGIMGNLEGLFDTVNTQVGEIAAQVGTTPAAWHAGVFSLIRQLSLNRTDQKAAAPESCRSVPRRRQPSAVLYPIRCKTLLDGGRRRTKNLYGVFKRTVPAGQVKQ